MARILLVEDEDTQRKVLETILRSGGHEVFLAGNGAQAIVLAQDKRPEFVITDFHMPKVSGTDLCRKIRETGDLHDTYILLITADHGDQGKIEGLLAGADDYLAKPVGKEELLARVQIGLRIRRMRQQGADASRRAVAAELGQQALADAMRAAEKGLQDGVMRLSAEDRDGALKSLRAANDALRNALLAHTPTPAADAAPDAAGH